MEIRREPLRESPKIGDHKLEMPPPTQLVFSKTALDEFSGVEVPVDMDIDEWIYPSVRVARNSYFRLRYRGEVHRWHRFFPDEQMADRETQPDECLGQFVAHNLWAPATDLAVDLYRATQENKYRTTAIFAGGMHAYDATDQCLTFVDRSLANDSGVRNKHIMLFLRRLHDVKEITDQLGDDAADQDQKSFFIERLRQFHLLAVEAAVQNLLDFQSYFFFIDPNLSMSDRYSTEKSMLLDCGYLPQPDKLKIVQRFKSAAYESYLRQDYDHVFLAQVLANIGIVDVSACYDEIDEVLVKWWMLTPEDLLTEGFVTAPPKGKMETTETTVIQGQPF